MTEDVATVVARVLLVLSTGIVFARGALAARVRRERSRSPWQFSWSVMVAAFAILFWHPIRLPAPRWYDIAIRPIAVAIMIAAEALATWAYVRLGRYWSGEISVLPDHRLVEGGPFAIVRHPVYLGFGLFVAGGALLIADPAAGLFAALAALVMYFRAREEERFLIEHLGDEYAAYRRRVPMLLPWPRR